MKLSEYASYDGIGLSDLVRKGDVTPRELASLATKAIEKTNPLLNFMASYAGKDVEQTLQANTGEGDFNGLPFLMKAGAAVKGQPVSMGSRINKDMIAPADEELTRRFRKAGVTILGHTTAPEFGNSATTESVLYGPSRNPWDRNKMTGGSSGGAAAAVAAGVLPVAMASDGGGSIRIPAHCCGVFGMKPTRARTPVGPHTQGGFHMPLVQHVVSRSVRDSAAMLDILQGPEAGALYHVQSPQRPYLQEVEQPPAPLKIAFSTHNPSNGNVDQDCVNAVREAMALCEELGHHVEERAFEYDWELFRESFLTVWTMNLPWSIALMEKAGMKACPDTLESSTLACLEYGRSITAEDIGRTAMAMNSLCRQAAAFFDDCDIYVTPTCAQPAIPIGDMDANKPGWSALAWFDRMVNDFSPFTPVFNATGQPAMSVPLYQSEKNLPVGVQFTACHGEEAMLFRLAGQLEQAVPWKHRMPGISVFSE